MYYLPPCRFLSALLLRAWFAHEVVSGGGELMDRLTTPDGCVCNMGHWLRKGSTGVRSGCGSARALVN